MGYETMRVEHGGDGVAVVTMDRPERLNAMGPVFFRELRAVMEGLDTTAGVRAAVLTGAGRAFSAGGDIDSFAALDRDTEAVRAHLRVVYDGFHAVERAQTPVIGAVNGLAYGGGTELALACDVVVAAESAAFAFKEPTVGLTPGYGVIRGPEVMGRHWTRYLALTGDAVDAATAERAGLVQFVVPDAELMTTARAIAGRIAANPPLAVRVGKQFVNRDTGSAMRESVEATALLFTTDDHRAAVAAFLERREARA